MSFDFSQATIIAGFRPITQTRHFLTLYQSFLALQTLIRTTMCHYYYPRLVILLIEVAELYMSRSSIRFLRDRQLVELDQFAADQTVLDYLRLDERSMGTKEGCAEGDCGACTVVIGEIADGSDEVVYKPVTSCIHLLGMLDGKQLITVDDLAPKPDFELHPVQAAMVDAHASQCGFCTPGFVMSLFALYHQTRPDEQSLDRRTVNDCLAGNLCRCTGYRPITQAALSSCSNVAADRFSRERSLIRESLQQCVDDQDVQVSDDNSERFFAAPASLDHLATLAAAHPLATIVSGGTDVGLWITKSLKVPAAVIYTGRVRGFDRIESNADGSLSIAAGATYQQAEAALTAIHPDVGEVLRRLGSKQIRATGTIGGNIANGSPIGDMAPMLIALDATVELRHGDSTRSLPIERFFVDYGKQDLAAGELLTLIHIPALAQEQHLRCFKLSKRFDQDISCLLVALRLGIQGQQFSEARIAFGGMAGIPKRAAATEAALIGVDVNDHGALTEAISTVNEDYQPLSDMRASATYRSNVAVALLQKAIFEIAQSVSMTASTEAAPITRLREPYSASAGG